MTTLGQELRRKFSTPQALLFALGMDGSTVDKIMRDMRGGKQTSSKAVRKAFAMTPRFQLAYDQAMAEQRPIMNFAAVKRLTELLENLLDANAMTKLQNEIGSWVPDHREDVSGERKTALDDVDLEHTPGNAMQVGLGGHLAGDPEQRAAAAMDARLARLSSDSDFDHTTRRLAKRFGEGVTNITSGWSRG